MFTGIDDRNGYVLCPFFKYCSGKTHKICCEGPIPDTSVSVNFPTNTELQQHLDLFCKKNFEKCELYEPTLLKYEDDDLWNGSS